MVITAADNSPKDSYYTPRISKGEPTPVRTRVPLAIATMHWAWGIGFLTADKIAQSVGIPHDSPQRVKAGLQFTLSEATNDGNCYLPENELIGAAIKILQVDAGLVIECLAELVAAFSLGTDLGLGQPMEHVLRSWRIAAMSERMVAEPRSSSVERAARSAK